MKSKLPQPSTERLAAAVNKYLIPALLKQEKKVDKPA